MGFRPPVFNSTCNLWTGPAVPPVGPPRLTVVCQLRNAGKLHTGEAYVVDPTTTNFPAVVMTEILFPLHTDVRDIYSAPAGSDVAECPAGSGRFYATSCVEDVAKGFTNEYRVAYALKVGLWPTPIP
jgi:hypothetical protein